jgi:hypothetical protein
VIVAFLRLKRNPLIAVRQPFPLDLMGIFRRYGGNPAFLQATGIAAKPHRIEPRNTFGRSAPE